MQLSSHAIAGFRGTLDLRSRLTTAWQAFQEYRLRRGVYGQIRLDLESMSDRELADMGISRLSISDIASQAAFGKAFGE